MTNGGGAMQSRPYESPADLRLMQALSSACWRADWPAPLTHPGDLDWWSRDLTIPGLPLAERVRLWFEAEPDASPLVAWAWLSPTGDVDLLIRPDLRAAGLVESIVVWAVGRIATGADSILADTVQAFAADAQPAVIEALRGLGFARVESRGLAQLTRAFEGWHPPAPALPAGFSLRTLASDEDVVARVVCSRAAFPRSTMTAASYESVRRRAALYRPSLDWLVIAPDGSVGAFALGWLDPVNLAVELEPVGVHPSFQRRGLGRAVCLSTIGAARELGAIEGMICAEGDNPAALGLYASLGYEIRTWTRPYRRPVDGLRPGPS